MLDFRTVSDLGNIFPEIEKLKKADSLLYTISWESQKKKV